MNKEQLIGKYDKNLEFELGAFQRNTMLTIRQIIVLLEQRLNKLKKEVEVKD